MADPPRTRENHSRPALEALKWLDATVKSIAGFLAAVLAVGGVAVAANRLFRDPPMPMRIVVEETSEGNHLIEGPVADLGTPPEYEPDASGGEYHCDVWQDWFEEKQAVQNLQSLKVQVRAQVRAPVTITRIRGLIFEKRNIEEAVQVQCGYTSGGGLPGTYADLDLDRPSDPLHISPGTDRDAEFPMPPGRFNVNAGETETLELHIDSGRGSIIEFGLEITLVEDGKERIESYGTKESPFRTVNFAYTDYATFDWDRRTETWSSGLFE